MSTADNRGKPKANVQVGTYREFSYDELKPNPQNPRRLFDEAPLETLKESITTNGILVPLTVYQERRNDQFYILDGERRWRCAELIETDKKHPRKVPIPANVVDPPTPVANVLWMFNIHNLRAQWELMPTALSLQVLMDELNTTDEKKLSELTKLSEPHVRRCKLLLTFPKKYQQMMMDVDPANRVKSNFFIEVHPVLDLYMKLPKGVRNNLDRNELTDHFLQLYKKGKVPSVVHFRRILEANDYIKDDETVDETKEALFIEAARKFATSTQYSVRQLFEPLTVEDKSVRSAENLCMEFLEGVKQLKIDHVTKRARLRKALMSVQKYVNELLIKFEE